MNTIDCKRLLDLTAKLGISVLVQILFVLVLLFFVCPGRRAGLVVIVVVIPLAIFFHLVVLVLK